MTLFCFSLQWISEEGWKPITNVDKDKPWTAEELDMMFTVEGKVEDMMVRRYVILVSSSLHSLANLGVHLAVHSHQAISSCGFVPRIMRIGCAFCKWLCLLHLFYMVQDVASDILHVCPPEAAALPRPLFAS